MGAPINPGVTVESLSVNNQPTNEQTLIIPSRDTAQRAIITVTCRAFEDTNQGDFFLAHNATSSVAVWLNKDNDNTEPSGPIYLASDIKVKVDISPGMSAASVAGEVYSYMQLDAAGQFSLTDNTDGTLLLECLTEAEVENPSTHSASESGAGSFVAVQTVVGGDPNYLEGLYSTLFDDEGNAFHLWSNLDDSQADPSPASSTGIEVPVTTGITAAQVAQAIIEAINSTEEFNAVLVGADRVEIRNNDSGNCTDANQNNAAWVVSKIRDGGAGFGISPSDNPSGITNDPMLD